MFFKTGNIIQKSKNLKQCENIFLDLIEDIYVLGQIYLTKEELSHIGNLLKNKIETLNSDDSYLKKKAPITTSLHLLHLGKKEYQEGNFWDPIYNQLGIKDRNNKWNAILGDLFYYVINKYKLIEFNPGRNKYVNQILAHGMVPDKYRAEFFENFLYKEGEDLLELSFSRSDVNTLLKNIREDHKGHKKSKTKLKKLEKEVNQIKTNIKDYSAILNNYDQLREIKSLLEETNNIDEVDELLHFPKKYLENKQAELKELKQKQQQTQKNLNQLNISIKEYKNLKEKFDKKQKEIKKIKKEKSNLKKKIKRNGKELLYKSWCDQYLKVIDEIPFLELKKLLNRYYKYCNFSGSKESVKGFIQYLWFLFCYMYFVLSGRKYEIENKIEHLYNELPLIYIIKPGSPFEIFNKLKEIKIYSKQITDLDRKIKTYKHELTGIKETSATQFTEKEISETSFLDKTKEKKNRLQEKLKEQEQKIEDIQTQIKNYKMKLNIISGDEGVEAVRKKLNYQREIKNKLTALKQKVDIKGEKLEELLNIINKKERVKIKNKLIHMKSNLKVHQKEIKKTKTTLEAYPERLYSLIEPTRIFIFQGEEAAEIFIYNCLQILQIIQSKKLSNTEIEANPLPENFIKHLQNWWSEYEQQLNESENRVKNKKYYNIKPFLQYSSEHNQLEIVLPEQKLTQNRKNKELPILYLKTTFGTIIKKEKLQLYFDKENVVKTNSLNYTFPDDYDQVSMEVIFNNDKIIEQDFEKRPYYYLREMKVSDYNPLNYEKIELIIREDYNFEPEGIVIQKQKLTGPWSNYTHYYLQTEDLDYLNIFNDRGKLIDYYNNDQTFDPRLTGGNISKKFRKDNTKVYEEKSPTIIFTIDQKNKLRLWKLIIIKNGEKILNVNLDQIKNKLDLTDNLVQILTERLVKNKYGAYRVLLKRRSPYQKSLEFDFVVIPEFDVEFNKNLYPPQNENKVRGQVNIELPKDCSFNVDNDEVTKEIVEKNTKIKETFEQKKIEILFNLELKYLTGQFIYKKKNNNFKFDLSLEIPILTWKIQGTDFNTEYESIVKEIWYQDILDQEEAFLEINLPSSITSNFNQLILNQGEQKITKREKGNKKFDLMKFSDNIRNSKKTIQNISAKIDNAEDNNTQEPIPLFNIRIKGEITDLKYEAKYDGDYCQLNIEWKQLGRSSNREIYLWNQETETRVYSQEMEDDIDRLSLKIETAQLPPGNYLLEFKKKELWGKEEMKFPSSDKLNTFVLSIGNKKDFVAEIKKYGLKLLAVMDENNNRYLLQKNYEISNIRKSERLDFEGEERYQGELIIFSESNNGLSIEKMELNPVSFYFTAEELELPFLVDKDKDGFTFCKKCGQLYWELINTNHSEYKHKEDHILPMKYLVKINR